MNAEQSAALRDLLRSQEIAALGTLHEGRPYVSMAPFAILPGGEGFVIHVSRLAAHTKDMLLDPRVSLLVVGSRSPCGSALETPRLTIQGEARQCPEQEARHATAKAAYLSRFPQSAELFGFGDFSLFVIEPESARFVGGFAQARTLSAQALAEALHEG
jgi:putative heme iron utilization protein